MRKAALLFFVFIYSLHLYAQNVQDCPGGIQVCSPMYTQSNSYTGYGAVNELTDVNDGCLNADPGEQNSVWYIVTVTQPGILAFTITPNIPNTDYDWAVWDITNSGCSSLYNYNTNTPNSYPPVRCNTSGNYGPTGLSTTACCPSEGAGNTPQFSSALAVTAGQVFAICLDNWSASTSGYTLDFTPSTASIYDTTHPRFDTINTYCGLTDSISFELSEAVKCTSLASNGSDFYITPTLATPIQAAGLSCVGTTGTTTTSIGVKFSTPLPPGNYVLHAQNGTDGNTLLDYCGDAQPVGDSISFTILAPPSFNPSPVDTICLNDSAQLNVTVTNPMAGMTYSYQWLSAQYINDTTIANPKVSPPGNTSYVVTVNQNGAIPCSSNDTFNVVVLPNDFTLLTNDTAICIGASVQVNASGSPFFSYLWTPASGISDTAIINPLITPDSGNTYVVTATFPGCPPMSHSFSISVASPSPTIPINKTACQGTPVQLDVTVPGNAAYQYSWAPATYLSDPNIPNPIDSVSAAGDFTYIVTVRPVIAGCYTFDTVLVHVIPNAFTIFNNDTAICQGASVQVNASGDTDFAYTWIPTIGVSNYHSLTPLLTPDTSETYTITATNPGCPDIVHTLSIDVQPNPTVYLGDSRFTCQFDSVHLDATVTPWGYPDYIYTWTSTSQLTNINTPDAIYAADTTGTFIITLNVSTPAGCQNSDSTYVTVYPGQFASLLVPTQDTAICPTDSVQLMASGATQYQWSPGSTLSDSVIANPVAHPTATQYYTLIATSQYGCYDTLNVNIVVHPAAVLDLGDSVILYPGETYQMNPQTNCVSFNWFPLLGLTAANISNPIASPDVSTKYIVTASTADGCSVVDSIKVHVDPNTLLALPNAFTPGNGPNNELKIIKRGIATLNYFRIFNRWGDKVFETANIDDGWDGTLKGAPQPLGVYVYEIEAETNTGQRFYKQGNITLLR